MQQTRRQFLSTTAAISATAGGISFLPFAAKADGHSADVFKAASGEVSVHPVNHASVVFKTPNGTIYVDPVGDPAAYKDFPAADLVLITHHHGDHFKPDTLAVVVGAMTKMVTNPTVYDKLPDGMKAKATSIGNGSSADFNGVSINAIPAYNTTAERTMFHPKGRDNGYVLNIEDLRVYLSGDTEDIPEMRALTDIDVAFVCMNLPFTMDAKAAASAVAEFKPTNVYPYHYRGRDGGTQDPAEFAKLVGDAATVKIGNWYG